MWVWIPPLFLTSYGIRALILQASVSLPPDLRSRPWVGSIFGRKSQEIPIESGEGTVDTDGSTVGVLEMFVEKRCPQWPGWGMGSGSISCPFPASGWGLLLGGISRLPSRRSSNRHVLLGTEVQPARRDGAPEHQQLHSVFSGMKYGKDLLSGCCKISHSICYLLRTQEASSICLISVLRPESQFPSFQFLPMHMAS